MTWITRGVRTVTCIASGCPGARKDTTDVSRECFKTDSCSFCTIHVANFYLHIKIICFYVRLTVLTVSGTEYFV